MKTFSQLKKISELYTKTATKIPYNAFVLCNQLQLKYKVKFQYEEDYKDGYNPLNSTPAFLCKNNNDITSPYTIYFDESSQYWQFYIFHEISHYILEHTTDDPEQEREANMLACLLIAPPHLIPTYLKNANDLSVFADIPIGRAEEYWQYIKPNKNKNIKSICIVLWVLIISIGFIICTHITNSNNIINGNEQTTQVPLPTPTLSPFPTITSQPITENDITYYVTSSGNKYHLPNCQYIKNKNNIRAIKNPEQEGYEPCKRCIK